MVCQTGQPNHSGCAMCLLPAGVQAQALLELRGDRELNSMRAMMCCWLWPTLSQHSGRELQGSNAEPSLAAWALSHGQHNYQVQGCKSGEEGQAHLEHRRDEAAVRHGDGQGDVDMLIVGDALGIRRAHCRRGDCGFWTARSEASMTATGTARPHCRDSVCLWTVHP